MLDWPDEHFGTNGWNPPPVDPSNWDWEPEPTGWNWGGVTTVARDIIGLGQQAGVFPTPGQTMPAVTPVAWPTLGGVVAGTIAGAAATVAGAVGLTILKIRQALTGRVGGMTPGALAGYGRRVWDSLVGWVQRNPGTSAIAILTGLGLTVQEAAQFLAWGATQRRRRRARGISAADLRRTRSTMRKVIGMSRQLGELCTGVRGYRRRRAPRRK